MVKKTAMARKRKGARKLRPSEDELRRDFERYQRLLSDLGRRFRIEPILPGEQGAASKPTYTSEANFVYEIHALT